MEQSVNPVWKMPLDTVNWEVDAELVIARYVVVASVEVANREKSRSIEDDAVARRPALNVCKAVQVLGLERFKDATTSPIAGEMESVPSALVTEVTAPREDALIHDPWNE